ncbi:MAG: Do family serine endopeptidase [Bacteroidaceae bacterium]|nr:Do family serine endopeptidase [Bacteroidaceae bacterium]
MRVGNVSMVSSILLLCTSIIACGSTYKSEDSNSVESLNETVYIPTSYRSTGLDFTQAAESTVNAVVSIRTTTEVKSRGYQDPIFEFFFGPGHGQREQRPQSGLGSGVIVSSDGYIVTNNHVIEGADKLEVTLNDNRSFNGRIIGADPTTDLALVKIEADNLPTVKFGNSDNLKIGEWVLAVGNPFGLTSTVTAGIVSAKARRISGGMNRGQLGIESFIQTDAAVNPGNSGGALVNTAGELVGINTAIFSQTGNYAGYSFAIPSSIVSKVIADLRQYGTVQRAVMGVSFQEITSELAKEKKLDVHEGVYVAEVRDRSAAFEAGVEVGDVITAIDGKKITNGSSLQEQIGRFNPGDKIKVTLRRNGKDMIVDMTLKNNQGNTEVTKAVDFASMGAVFKELTDTQKRELNVRNGVEVVAVKDGKFKSAGIRDGFVILDINNATITSVKDVEKIFDSITRSNSERKVMFITGIYPNGKLMYYAVDLSD